ncbi:MAG TPA: dipeptidase PepV [Clostridiaceae bacterium]
MDINEMIDELREKIIISTLELVKIKSLQGEAQPGMPFGEGVSKVLNKALEISKALGFTTRDIDGFIGYAEYMPEGIDPNSEDYIGVLGHLDVVPEGTGWTYPPYGGEIHKGKIYGRGTTDDKSPIVAALYGLKAVKELNLPLSKKVRIIFGTNEETGCGEIKHYLAKEKPPVAGFTPDAQYPIIYAEKGITVFDIRKMLDQTLVNDKGVDIIRLEGGLAANMVPANCEAEIKTEDTTGVLKIIDEFVIEKGFDINYEVLKDTIVLYSKGKAAHGSLPEQGQNAIMQLFLLLGKLQVKGKDLNDFIAFMNKYVALENHGEALGIGLSDEPSGKLSFNVGVATLTGSDITLALNLRYPVTNTYEDMMVPFNKMLEGEGIVVINMLHMKPLYYPKDHPLIKTLCEVFVDYTGLTAEPLAIGGGTYAKEMPNIVAFGPIFPGKPDLDHQVDEYVEIEDLILNAKIYGEAIYRLAK